MVTPAPTLAIRLLGPFEVTVAGEPVDPGRWQRRKTRQLIKLLALQPHRQLHKEEVLDLLWPELDGEQAASALRKVIHDARHGLEPALRAGAHSRYVRTEDRHVRLSAPGGVSVDVEEFERRASTALDAGDPAACDAALALYRGDLLSDEPYEDWCTGRREYTRSLWRDLVCAAAHHRAERGDVAHAVELLERLLGHDAADEEAHMLLMRLHASAGNRNAALQQYRRCAEALRRELDCDPSDETTSLFDELRRSSSLSRAPIDRVRAPAATVSVPTGGSPGVSTLPHYATTFVGRADDLRAIADALARRRLVTLTGAGGSGKTRIAVETCRIGLGERSGPAWFVDLAVVGDPGLVAKATADALGLSDASGRPPLDLIAASLKGIEALLVLDNCEHVVDACAVLSDRLLGSCETVRILATSREPLGVAGEATIAVLPLDQPALGDTIDAILASDAVRLFADRAALANPRWSLREGNASAVATICRELDGIPLSIELAAAHVRSMSVGEIVARLGERFRLLRSTGRLVEERHKTLRAAIDWSYGLLLETERIALRRLAVFSGGWTIDSAEDVIAGSGLDAVAVLPHLERLVDKSLVYVDATGTIARYRMLETVRLYGAEKLERSGEGPAVREKHLRWIVDLAVTATAVGVDAYPGETLDRIQAEIENVRAALVWSASHHPETHLRLCGALGVFWHRRSRLTEGRYWLERAIASSPEAAPALRALALHSAGNLARQQSDYATSRRLLEEALELRRAIDDPALPITIQMLGNTLSLAGELDLAEAAHRESFDLYERAGNQIGMAGALSGLGGVATWRGDEDEAYNWYEQSLALMRAAGDTQNAGIMLFNLADSALTRGNVEDASHKASESLRIAQQCGDDTLLAYSAVILGTVAIERGDVASAADRYEQALAIYRTLGDQLLLSNVIEGAALVAGGRRDYDRALQLMGAAEAIRTTFGTPRDEYLKSNVDRLAREAFTAIGTPRGEREIAAGTSLSIVDIPDVVQSALRASTGTEL